MFARTSTLGSIVEAAACYFLLVALALFVLLAIALFSVFCSFYLYAPCPQYDILGVEWKGGG